MIGSERTPNSSRTRYWLNFDKTGVKLHKGSCPYVRQFAVKPKWKLFKSKKDSYAFTSRTIKKCGICW